jgi:hypothetical protein
VNSFEIECEIEVSDRNGTDISSCGASFVRVGKTLKLCGF